MSLVLYIAAEYASEMVSALIFHIAITWNTQQNNIIHVISAHLMNMPCD